VPAFIESTRVFNAPMKGIYRISIFLAAEQQGIDISVKVNGLTKFSFADMRSTSVPGEK